MGSRRETFHTTREGNVGAIKREGFSGKPGDGGAYFGEGTYVHTKEEDSDAFTSGSRMFIWGDEVSVRTQVKTKNLFPVKATSKDLNPEGVMLRAMMQRGLAKEGEELSPSEIKNRLKKAGFDGVEVKQDYFNHDIAGNQISVFDPQNVRIRPEHKVEKVIRLKKPRG